MKKTPKGTPVGVDDPYSTIDKCDFITSDGRCRLVNTQKDVDPSFLEQKRTNEFKCHVIDKEDGSAWEQCEYFQSRQRSKECKRCGLPERRLAHSSDRPLLEEHHLSYADDKEMSHEITIFLCRWCHAAIHSSWARIDDEASPTTEALAEAEGRRSKELNELGFETAAKRFLDE